MEVVTPVSYTHLSKYKMIHSPTGAVKIIFFLRTLCYAAVRYEYMFVNKFANNANRSIFLIVGIALFGTSHIRIPLTLGLN